MDTESIALSAVIPASPDEVYAAWLDSERHTAMTGSQAEASSEVGGRFSAWSGFIGGQNLELEPGRRIVQSWRTTAFPAAAAESVIELVLTAVEGGCRIELAHREIPVGQGKLYLGGWQDRYFTPMVRFFGSSRRTAQTS
jgi:activator of HSP90 ATPase